MNIDNVKVEVDINGATKTIDIANLNKIMPYFDVSGEIQIDEESGNPSFESMDSAARNLLKDIYEAIPRA